MANSINVSSEQFARWLNFKGFKCPGCGSEIGSFAMDENFRMNLSAPSPGEVEIRDGVPTWIDSSKGTRYPSFLTVCANCGFESRFGAQFVVNGLEALDAAE